MAHNDFSDLDISVWEGVQYNDLAGYSAADHNDCSFSDIFNIPEGQMLIGVEMQMQEGDTGISVTPYFAYGDKMDDFKELKEINAIKGESVELSPAEFFKHFKRFGVICFKKALNDKRISL